MLAAGVVAIALLGHPRPAHTNTLDAADVDWRKVVHRGQHQRQHPQEHTLRSKGIASNIAQHQGTDDDAKFDRLMKTADSFKEAISLHAPKYAFVADYAKEMFTALKTVRMRRENAHARRCGQHPAAQHPAAVPHILCYALGGSDCTPLLVCTVL